MSETLDQEAYNQLLLKHFENLDKIQQILMLMLPDVYQPPSLRLSRCEKQMNASRWVVYSLMHTWKIIRNHSTDSEENRDALLHDLRQASSLVGFWQACESHGRLVGLKNRTNSASNRQRFISRLPPETALAAALVLENVAMTHGSQCRQESVLRQRADEIARLLEYEGFPRQEFMKILGSCAEDKHQIEQCFPTTPDEIRDELRESDGIRSVARSCWISHHLWAMDSTSRCLFLTKSGTATQLKNMEKLSQASGDNLFASSEPTLRDFDKREEKFPNLTGFFQPRFDLLPVN
ncbi:MAG: hypothetical protein ACRCXD_08715 [Luteolibacter sp.]